MYNVKILSAPLCCSGDTYGFLRKIWDDSLLNIQEQVYALYLNGSNEVISWRCINTGTGSELVFDLKFTLSLALNCLATKIIIAHNHPSGILKPSYSDIAMTAKFNQAADILDMKLEDHLIINQRDFYSFRDHLLIK